MFLQFLECSPGAEVFGKMWWWWGVTEGVRLVCEEDGLDGRLHSERLSLSVLAAVTAGCF